MNKIMNKVMLGVVLIIVGSKIIESLLPLQSQPVVIIRGIAITGWLWYSYKNEKDNLKKSYANILKWSSIIFGCTAILIIVVDIMKIMGTGC